MKFRRGAAREISVSADEAAPEAGVSKNKRHGRRVSNPTGSDRIFELDALRGIALILMCLDHFAYDLTLLQTWFPGEGYSSPIFRVAQFGWQIAASEWRTLLHYIFASVFLLTAGIGSALSRRPARRFLKVFAAAVAVCAVTVAADAVFDWGVSIYFGVLSVTAVGLFAALLCEWCGAIGKWVALFAGSLTVLTGFLIAWYDAPALYRFSWDRFVEIACGTVRCGSDWFPIFPCAGVILIGYFLGKILYRSRRSLVPFLGGKTCVLCFVGKHTLIVYLLHQPIIAAVVYAMGLCLSRT